MEKGYFQAAWNDIKQTPNWFGKLCLMGLVYLIPIFGQIVVYGYLFGWSREIAWNLNKPMPAHLFGNEDGKLYRQGWFAFVINLVMAIPALVVYSIALGIDPSLSNTGLYAPIISVAGVLIILSVLLALLADLAWLVGSMRMVIYDRLGAGLQFKQVFKMMGHDFGGMLRILGMRLLLSLIVAALILVLAIPVGVIAGMVSVGGAAGMGMMGGAGIALLFLIMMMVPLVLLFIYACMVVSVFINAVAIRAAGYWVRNFRVAEWGGSTDSLPYERDAANTVA